MEAVAHAGHAIEARYREDAGHRPLGAGDADPPALGAHASLCALTRLLSVVESMNVAFVRSETMRTAP